MSLTLLQTHKTTPIPMRMLQLALALACETSIAIQLALYSSYSYELKLLLQPEYIVAMFFSVQVTASLVVGVTFFLYVWV